MDTARLVELVRNFPQNGMKLLLETPANVRDLLHLVAPAFAGLINFDRMTPQPTDFIARDFRHVEADVVLRAPVRDGGRAGRGREVLIYVLIEHQSEPDRLMPLRLLDYVTQIYKAQGRDWGRRRKTFAGIRLQPVLPVVLYTGDRPWPDVGTIAGLMDLSERFAAVTPAFTPLFLNLPVTSDGALGEGGAFGAILRLYRERRADGRAFRGRTAAVLRAFKTLPKADRLRWLELLSYIDALVYHDRDPIEHSGLRQLIQESLTTDADRREYMAAHRSMADVLKAEGAITHARNTLVQLLRTRFRRVPAPVVERIKTTDELKLLDGWINRVVTVHSLDELGILPHASAQT